MLVHQLCSCTLLYPSPGSPYQKDDTVFSNNHLIDDKDARLPDQTKYNRYEKESRLLIEAEHPLMEEGAHHVPENIQLFLLRVDKSESNEELGADGQPFTLWYRCEMLGLRWMEQFSSEELAYLDTDTGKDMKGDECTYE
jgi:hypothetical protein